MGRLIPNVVLLWRTLDSLYPMPISRSRDRILTYIYNARQLGLITADEASLLRDSDRRDRDLAAGTNAGPNPSNRPIAPMGGAITQ